MKTDKIQEGGVSSTSKGDELRKSGKTCCYVRIGVAILYRRNEWTMN